MINDVRHALAGHAHCCCCCCWLRRLLAEQLRWLDERLDKGRVAKAPIDVARLAAYQRPFAPSSGEDQDQDQGSQAGAAAGTAAGGGGGEGERPSALRVQAAARVVVRAVAGAQQDFMRLCQWSARSEWLQAMTQPPLARWGRPGLDLPLPLHCFCTALHWEDGVHAWHGGGGTTNGSTRAC